MFAAGCFWDVEAAFRRVAGVLDTRVGYTGGTLPDPDHDQVMSGGTGHVQAVLVEYDPERVAYRQLLDLFWSIHDPSALGADPDSPQRSIIFHFDAHQRRAALAARARQGTPGLHGGPITTEIRRAGPFYPAAEHHQRRHEKRSRRA